jgi:hypothetical protein
VAARAVVIGAETYGLTGCDADVELLSAHLVRRGFDVTCLTGGDACRADILAALDDLVDATDPGDAAVIYYSGHGGRLARPDAEQRKAEGRSAFFQFLVPTDMKDSTPGDFRGVLSEELSAVQRRLVEAAAGKPVNATTILDCCHSGYLARNLTARSRAVDLATEGSKMFAVQGILDHVEALGGDADISVGETNTEVVRMSACQAEQSAFELPTHRGPTHGVFSDALVMVLDDIGDAEVSWRMVGDLVRRRVRSVVPEQRPEVEGPGDRRVFGAGLVDAAASLPLEDLDGRLAIPAAALFGVGRGDEIRLLVPGSKDPERKVAVTEIRSGSAVLDVPADQVGAALADVIATPVRLSIPPVAVEVGDGPGRDTIITAIASVPSMTTEGGTPLVRLRSTGDRWQIDDALGAPWRTGSAVADEAGVASIVAQIAAIATGHRLLDLPSGSGAHSLGDDVEIRLCRVVNGERVDVARHGERIAAGTPVTLTLRNRSDEPRYVWVFDVGVSGRSTLVTAAAPSGTRLGPADDEDDIVDIWGGDGTRAFWPNDVPVDETGRSEVFVVVTTSDRQDMTALASRSVAELASRGESRSPLDLLLDEVRVGSREMPTSDGDGDGGLRYRIDRLEFVLVPSD